MLQALYKEEFEKNKGKGFSVVTDTPELQRLKKTQDQISNVSPNTNMIDLAVFQTFPYTSGDSIPERLEGLAFSYQ